MRLNKSILILILAGILLVPFCKPDRKMLVDTGDVSNISTTTADVLGTVIDVGEGATQHGHCYGTAAGPTVSGTKTSLGVAAAGDFTSSLTGLNPETKYYVRAYTSLGAEAAYGSEISFTTASAALPELTTTVITSITKTSAVTGGNVTSEGGTPVTARGVCWNVATGPTIAETKTSNGSGSGIFASSITGLSSNTVYYVRAYATNSGGTAYGNEVSFTTSPEVAVAPAVTTSAVTSITSNSAVSGGDVTNEGGAPVTAKGVCWSTTANPTITSSKTTDGTGSGSFVSNLTNLNPGTTYYIRAYATNSAGTSYGNEYSFATTVVVPTLTTIQVTSVTSTTAISGGDITSTGGASITVRGVCWSTSQNPTIDNDHTSDGLGSGTYASNLTGLIGNTTYYVRAYATNNAGTAYGNELSFKTGAVVPIVTTTAVTSITSTTAISGGEISSDGGGSVTARGVCWSTSANPTTADTKTSDGTGTDPFTSSITGLTPGATYHVRAYATNSIGTAYGNDVSFTTSTIIPTVTISAITNITSTTATSGGTVTSDGGAAVTARGVCWSTNQNPTLSDYYTENGTGTGSYVSNITGLTSNTTYYVRAYATNSIGTAYNSNNLTFMTIQAPTATTGTSSNLATTSATLNGTVNANGQTTTVSFDYGTSTSYGSSVTASQSPVTGTSSTGVSANITGLTEGTVYHFRVKAVSNGGTTYGNDQAFSSLCILPSASTDACTGIGPTVATLNGTANANGFSTTVWFEYGTTTSYGTTLAATPSPITGSSNTTISAAISGLLPNTLYHYRVKTSNCGGTVDGNDQTFTTSCVAPTATTNAASGIGSTTATLNGTVNANGFSTTVTFEWGETTGYGSVATATQSPVGGSINTAVSAALTGLTPDKTYHYRVKAVNCEGTPVYGGDQEFTTSCTAPYATTNAASGLGSTTATLNGTVNANGFSTTVTFEWGETTGYGSAAAATQSPVEGSTNTAVSAVLAGLTPDKIYHYRVKAVNCEGTPVYGGDQQFTTSCSAPTVTTDAASGIGLTTATLNGTVNANGFSTTVSFEYGTSTSYGTTVAATPSPVTGSSNTSVNAALTGLATNTLYHYRVKAANCNPGPVYGSDMTFTTLAVVTTTAISNITSTTASSGGTVTEGGGASITARGVCWSTSPNPTTANSKTDDGIGTGVFLSNITGLTQSIIYYVRAYASNAGGTSYGDQLSLSTGVADFDGNSYSTIQIGTQLWMQENLKVTHYNDGVEIPGVTDNNIWKGMTSGAYCWYNNSETTYKDTYGALYNWFAVNSGKLCPVGWHATLADWTTLENYLGGYTIAGDKLKESGSTHWGLSNTGTNSSGYTALPGGMRSGSDGTFSLIGSVGYWWKSTEHSTSDGYFVGMYSDQSFTYDSHYLKTGGYSVRCIKD